MYCTKSTTALCGGAPSHRARDFNVTLASASRPTKAFASIVPDILSARSRQIQRTLFDVLQSWDSVGDAGDAVPWVPWEFAENARVTGWIRLRSEGLPRTGYFIPMRDGWGAKTSSKRRPCAKNFSFCGMRLSGGVPKPLRFTAEA